jgi:hypothetical protein
LFLLLVLFHSFNLIYNVNSGSEYNIYYFKSNQIKSNKEIDIISFYFID